MRSKFYPISFISFFLATSLLNGFVVTTGQFVYIGHSGSLSTYEDIGTLTSTGESSITTQLVWGRASNGGASAKFTIAEGFVVTAISAVVPNNQSANNPQDGTFTFGEFNGSTLSSQTWTIGESLPVIGSGNYAIEWFVPAKGSGGSSSAAGNGSFNITVETVPESSTYALAAGIFVLALTLYQRRKHL